MNNDNDISSNNLLDNLANLQIDLLNFFENDDSVEEKYQIIIQDFKKYEIHIKFQRIALLLALLSKISNNHYRHPDLLKKIEQILKYFKNEIKSNFSDSQIFKIFKSNKRILLFLLEEKILNFTEDICKEIITKDFINHKYPHYFYPEVKQFMNEIWFQKNNSTNDWIQEIDQSLNEDFYKKRQNGENDSYICELIRNDNIEEFIKYVNSNSLSLNSTISLSIYETNTFLIKASLLNNLTLINYAVAFGSIRIIQYLLKNVVQTSSSLWIFAVHCNNNEIIKILKNSKVQTDKSTMCQCLKESIRCHHIEISHNIIREYFLKQNEYSIEVIIDCFKFCNFYFIKLMNNEMFNELYFLNTTDGSDDELLINQLIKKYRGRPHTSDWSRSHLLKNNIRKLTNTKEKIKKKKNDNLENAKELDNPHLISIKAKDPFFIAIPFRNRGEKSLINSIYSQIKDIECCIDPDEIEDLFTGKKKEGVHNDSANDKKDDNDKNDSNKIIMFDELESKYAPFADQFTAHSYVAKANKEYVIELVDFQDPNYFSFRCKVKGCNYIINFAKQEDGYHIINQTYHTCKSPMIIDRIKLKKVIKDHGKREKLNKEYLTEINNAFGLPLGGIPEYKIRRYHNKIFDLDPEHRLKTWGKLNSFIDVIKAYGGNGMVHKTPDGLIDFVGFVPNYAFMFMTSTLFFPVVQLDTRFQTGISEGRLYALITLTGNRTIIPLAAGWAPTEKGEQTDLLLSLFGEKVHLIKSCHTDDSQALIGSIEKAGIGNILCGFHISLICPASNLFKLLISSKTSKEYEEIKQEIITKYPDLDLYLKDGSRWKKISRFESDLPRDLNIATSAVESFNAIIERTGLKKAEPLNVMEAIYNIGYNSLEILCSQNGILVDSARNYLDFAVSVANNLYVVQNSILLFRFDVSKDDNGDSLCIVIVNPKEDPKCTCMFHNDCGMPCVHMLAVALKFNFDWSSWIHPRYFVSNYKTLFLNNLPYPDFTRIIKTNDDNPVIRASLLQRQKRIESSGEVPRKH